MRQFASLPAPDRWLLLRAALLLPLVRVGRHVMSFKRLKRVIERAMPLKRCGGDAHDVARAQQVARLVQIAAAHGAIRANCLDRSLVLWGLLRRWGLRADLCIGARKRNGDFEAHAWVEYQGVVLNDTADVRDRFAVLHEQAEQTIV